MGLNKPVDFTTAKLLKEKGIIFETKLYYSSETKVTSVSYNEFAAPTIADVVMWLYEKHGIWIQGPFPYNDGKWAWIIFLLKEPLEDTDGYKNVMSLHNEPYRFNSPTEAYEAAIEYTLNNLI